MSEHYTTREKLIFETIRLWKKYGAEYRTLLDDYYYNLGNKRELMKRKMMKKMPLEPIRKKWLDEYPDIPLLNYRCETDVERYLRCLDTSCILRCKEEIEGFATSALTETLRSKIYDYAYQIKNRDVKKSDMAMSPEACKGGRHTRRTKMSQSTELNI